MTVEIRLSGEAAAQAQTLVAALVEQAIEVRSLRDERQDRSAETLLTDFGVALAAEASYGAVRDLVSRWAAKHRIDPGDIEVPAAGEAPAEVQVAAAQAAAEETQ